MVQSLKSAVVKLRKGKTITQGDLRRIMLWLAGSLLHSNAQRPGAVTNTTLEEYEAATVSSVGRETYKTFLVANHKTGTTGRAKLMADRNLITHLDTFVTHIRPALEGSSSKLLFPNREGKSLSRHVQGLASSLQIDLAPNNHCNTSCGCHCCCGPARSGAYKGSSGNVPFEKNTGAVLFAQEREEGCGGGLQGVGRV